MPRVGRPFATLSDYNEIMNVSFQCPRCADSVQVEIPTDAAHFSCPACRTEFAIEPDSIRDGHLQHCLICPSVDLFVRKDFSQRAGVAIVTIGFLLSSIAWYYYYIYAAYAILFATALVDVVCYFTLGDCLHCYRCQATYRATPLDKHGKFDLVTHERHRQQLARAVQTKPDNSSAVSMR